MDLATGLLATLFGVVIEKLLAWLDRKRAFRQAVELDALKRRDDVMRINAAIDREIDGEDDLRVLIDRL